MSKPGLHRNALANCKVRPFSCSRSARRRADHGGDLAMAHSAVISGLIPAPNQGLTVWRIGAEGDPEVAGALAHPVKVGSSPSERQSLTQTFARAKDQSLGAVLAALEPDPRPR